MEELLHRISEDLVARVTGPLKFRLILQPSMAAFFAIRAGLKDAKEGRSPHFWALLSQPANRNFLLRETWKQVGSVFIFAIAIDAVYQYWQLRWFYPFEALVVAVILAIVPYLIFRGLTNRLARVAHRNTVQGGRDDEK